MSTFYFFLFILFEVLSWAIFARAIVSWFPVNPNNRLIAALYQITEPVLAPLRHIIPTIAMFDITPMVGFILLQVAASLVRTLI